METKICRNCKTEKPKSEFHKAKRNKDGLNNICKGCHCEQSREHYAANSEAVSERGKVYRKANKDVISERKKRYRGVNKEVISERGKIYRNANKETISDRKKEHYAANAEAISERRKAHYEANKEVISEKGNAYCKENRDSINKRQRIYEASRRKSDPLFALRRRVRNLINIALTKQNYTKKAKNHEILGCSFEQFKAYIESQFVDGMSWHNRNEWHLDHIFPVSKATDEAHLIALNHYTNFQPLWAADNIRKRDKIPDHLVSPTEIY